jgi:hypothetical protein
VKHASRKRVVGIGSAWIAAYALVLNVVLSSFLLTALSPAAFAAVHDICANSADIGTVRDDAGKGDKKAAIHCPICIGKHTSNALPPPPGPVLFERSALPVSLEAAFDAVFVELARTSDHQARGPPSLI